MNGLKILSILPARASLAEMGNAPSEVERAPILIDVGADDVVVVALLRPVFNANGVRNARFRALEAPNHTPILVECGVNVDLGTICST